MGIAGIQKDTRIENLAESNVDDLTNVCSSGRLGDPIHQQGIVFKRQWLRRMLSQWGACAKIAYHDDRPVAQILFHPEEADTSKVLRRKDVLVLACIYNPMPEAQKLGIGTRLVKSVIEDVKQQKSCLGKSRCKFIVAKAFNTGELLPMPEFYKKNGFLPTPEEGQLWLPIHGSYEDTAPLGEYEPLEEDKNRALVFFIPVCQFSYPFAKRIEAIIKEVAPGIPTELINEWEQPEESIKRKNCPLIVNAKPIRTFFMETEKFKHEVRSAATEK